MGHVGHEVLGGWIHLRIPQPETTRGAERFIHDINLSCARSHQPLFSCLLPLISMCLSSNGPCKSHRQILIFSSHGAANSSVSIKLGIIPSYCTEQLQSDNRCHGHLSERSKHSKYFYIYSNSWYFISKRLLLVTVYQDNPRKSGRSCHLCEESVVKQVSPIGIYCPSSTACLTDCSVTILT